MMKIARGFLRTANACLSRYSSHHRTFSALPNLAPDDKQSTNSFDSAEDFERRIFGDSMGNRPSSNSFFRKLDNAEKSYHRSGQGSTFSSGNTSSILDGLDESFNTLSDGMDDKLKQAASYFEVDPDEVEKDDYTFRADMSFHPGNTYELKDLDLRKPGVRKPARRDEFETTTKEVLCKADFRNVRFLANFITEAGIIHKRSKQYQLKEMVLSQRTPFKGPFLRQREALLLVVSENWNSQPQLATVGACCLVGAIYQQTLFVANLGDSRVVLGKKVGNTGEIAAIQLSTEHNANIESVRWELKDLHPNDPQIVVLRHGVWRVKGIIQVSRSIGDVYLKHTRFCREPINGKFRVPQPLNMPILLATPTILEHPLHPNDSFLIFASDGLWEHLSNEKAVEIVKSHPRKGSAKRLVKAALHVAAKKREMRYSDLRNIDKKVRRHFHDDISVIILFLNHELICRGVVQDPTLSIRSALEH